MVGQTQLLAQDARIHRDFAVVAEEAAKILYSALAAPAVEHLTHERTLLVERFSIDDTLARQRDDVRLLNQEVRKHYTVRHVGMEAGILEPIDHRSMLYSTLAGYVAAVVPINLDQVAVDQLLAACLDLHEQEIASRREHDQIDLAVTILLLLDRVPRNAVEHLVAAWE